MNYSLDEHNPPHIHGVINDRRCSVLLNGDVLEGKQFPKKLLNELVKFVLSHQEELTKMWEEQKFTKLD